MSIKPRDPGWLLTVTVAALALFVAGSSLVMRLTTPSELAIIRTELWGWTSDGVRVDPTSTGSAFEPGDVVTAMNGRPLVEWADGDVPFAASAPNPAIGTTVVFDVHRNGQTAQLVVALVPFTVERIGSLPVWEVLFALFVLVLAVVLVARRPRSTALRLLFVVAAAHIADTTVWEVGLQPTDVARGDPFVLAFAAGSMFNLVFLSAIVHLLAIYPTRSRLLVRRPRLSGLIYAAPLAAFAALAIGARLVGGTTLEWVDRLASCHALVASSMLVVVVGSVLAAYRRTTGPVRRSVRWVALSLALAAVATLCLLTLPFLVSGATLLPRNVVDLLVLPVPVVLVAAIVRDRLFAVALLSRGRERLVAAREDERRRLRRDLHDELAPALAAVGLRLDLARQSVRTKPELAEATIDQARHEIRAVIAGIRRMSRELRPPALDSLGLAEAVRQQADALQGDAGASTRITVVVKDALPVLPAAVEVAAYRIAVEGMMNVVRHAGATACEVRMTLVGNELAIAVTDNGGGIDTSGEGVGMRSMKERAAEVGGDVTIDSERGTGTVLLARLPVDLALSDLGRTSG